MKRYDIINHLITKNNFQSYLEIGVLDKECINQISCQIKDSVDPNGKASYTMTSDEFFANYCKQNYDIIFIDGLHVAEQVLRDINNSLKYLKSGGIICCHDISPAEEYQQFEIGVSGRPWTGTAWKAWANLRCTRQDLLMYVIDADYGCGIIQKGKQDLYIKPDQDWDWNYLDVNRRELLNLISIEDFLCGYPKK